MGVLFLRKKFDEESDAEGVAISDLRHCASGPFGDSSPNRSGRSPKPEGAFERSENADEESGSFAAAILPEGQNEEAFERSENADEEI